MTETLTKQQQELVASNHNLIYKFAYNKNLVIDEYYDILAIGMCKAAKIYDENKGNFSTLAYHCMNNELAMYCRGINKKSEIPNKAILSYDNTMLNKEDFEVNLLDIIGNDCSVQDIVIGNMIVNSFIDSLKENWKVIVKLLMSGMNQKEVGSYLNCSRQNINKAIMIIRKKWSMYSNK